MATARRSRSSRGRTCQLAAQTPKPAYDGPVFKIGNIGCGGRRAFVSKIIAENPGFKLAPACDYFGDRVQKFADTHSIVADERFTGLDGYKRMLAHMDAIAIHARRSSMCSKPS
jgi:hypothetical protein